GWLSLGRTASSVRGGLRRRLLVAHGSQAASKLGGNFVERTHELRDRGLHGAQQFREQLFARRHGGQSLHTFLVQQVVGQCARLDDQLVVAFRETGEDLGRRNRISADTIDQRTGELFRQRQIGRASG